LDIHCLNNYCFGSHYAPSVSAVNARSKGRLLVTNHDEPEAVIVSVPEYDALMHLVEQSETQTESALAGLRQNFNERLAVLQERSAAARLRSTIRGRAKLSGKVKAGGGY
jgi:prevent-host-death family protein